MAREIGARDRPFHGRRGRVVVRSICLTAARLSDRQAQLRCAGAPAESASAEGNAISERVVAPMRIGHYLPSRIRRIPLDISDASLR